ARLKPELTADVVHLGLLRLLDGHRRVRVVRARVLERLAVEPQPIEVDADIVVVVDVALRLGKIRREAAAALDPGRDAASVDVAVGGIEHGQQVAIDLDPPGAVEVAEVQLRIDEHLEKRLPVADTYPDPAVPRGRVGGRIPEDDIQRRVAETVDELGEDPAIEAGWAAARRRAFGVGVLRIATRARDAERL